MLLLLLAIIYMIIRYRMDIVKAPPETLLYFLLITLSFASFDIALSFCGIIAVEIDDSMTQIVLIKFFSKQVISTSEIEGYYESVSNTRRGASYGRIIKTRDGKIKELNPGNLMDVTQIDLCFNKASVVYLGSKRSFYPLTSGL